MNLENEIPDSWKAILLNNIGKEEGHKLEKFLEEEYRNKSIFPPKHQLFSAFQYFNPEDTRVVILGQDPYHGQGEANGLAFSVSDGVKIPPSLRNIFTEMHTDLGLIPPIYGNLEKWAKQGVLLLNTVLSVEQDKAGSHQNKGWENLSDAVLKSLNDQNENLVFVLWGKAAQKKIPFLNSEKHLILSSAHPSPLSAYRGFFGSKPFSTINKYLKDKGISPIDWNL